MAEVGQALLVNKSKYDANLVGKRDWQGILECV
jgi:hypothetical protein